MLFLNLLNIISAEILIKVNKTLFIETAQTVISLNNLENVR